MSGVHETLVYIVSYSEEIKNTCMLCCIIIIAMKTLNSKTKGAVSQAQCSGTKRVEKLALPQCIS